MINKLKELIERVIKKLLPKNDINKALGLDIALSSDMANAIQGWLSIAENKPPWVNEASGIYSLKLPNAIVREFYNTVTSELKTSVTNNDFLEEQYKFVIDDMSEWLQNALLKGGIALKPYIKNDEIFVDYVDAESFFPVSYDGRKRITAGVFVEHIVKGKTLYTRLEFQKYEDHVHTFINVAYAKKNYNNSNFQRDGSLGNLISLTDVPEWEELETEFTISNVNKPLFAYWRVPILNDVDTTSPLGVPIYHPATNLIQKADEQYGRYIWEFEGGELAVHASEDLFEVDSNDKPKLPEGKKRLYRPLEVDSSSGNKTGKLPMDVFSPALRDENYANGYNNILKRIEFNCGLSYGDLSDPQALEKTAQEIRTSKQRKYATVTAIQNTLQNTLEHLVYILNIYAIGLNHSNSKEVKLEINWGDSVLVDSETQRAIDMQEVAAGLLPKWRYKMKWQGLTKEQAKAEVNEENEKGIEYED